MSANNRGGPRIDKDAYQTPLWVVHALLPYIDWAGVSTFLEPCKGGGHIFNSLPPGIKKTWRELEQGRDYLTWTPKTEFDLIITNPPFSLGLEFLSKSLAEAFTVAYLLRVNFLGSVDRRAFWGLNEPTHMLTLTPRPSYVYGGTDSTEYAWFIWDRGGHVKPETPRIGVITHKDAPTKKIPLPSDTFVPPSLRAQAPMKQRRRKSSGLA